MRKLVSAVMLGLIALATPATGESEPPPPGVSISADGLDIHIKDVEIRKLLIDLAKVSRRKMIIYGGVEGRVTVDLHGVDFYDALDAISNTNGFRFRERKGIIYISVR